MTTDEIFENVQTLMDEPETEEDYLNIDWNTREITIPSSVPNLGVYNDKDTNRLYFRCPVQYGEFFVADFGIRINYKNDSANGDVYLVEDATVSNGYLTFTWLVGRNAYLLQSSTTQFSVCCKIIDGDGNVVRELNTTIASLKVLQGLETGEAIATGYPDVLEKYMEIAENADANASKAVEIANDANESAESAKQTSEQAKQDAEDALSIVKDVQASAITTIRVNGVDVPIEENTADISVPTKVSELENDSGYITKVDLPTKVSELENDSNYITVEETEKEVAEQIAEIVAGAPESLDTLKEIADWIENHADDAAAMNEAINKNSSDITDINKSIDELKELIENMPVYDGETIVIPKVNTAQTLETAHKQMEDDVTVEEVPRADVSNDKGGTTVTIG